MTKKEYCKTHPFIGWHNLVYFITIYIHGFEYGIDDYMYASIVRSVSATGDVHETYHKWKIRTSTSGRMYVRTAYGNIYLDECFRNSQALNYREGEMMRSL